MKKEYKTSEKQRGYQRRYIEKKKIEDASFFTSENHREKSNENMKMHYLKSQKPKERVVEMNKKIRKTEDYKKYERESKKKRATTFYVFQKEDFTHIYYRIFTTLCKNQNLHLSKTRYNFRRAEKYGRLDEGRYFLTETTFIKKVVFEK